jgi:hypothetical protein
MFPSFNIGKTIQILVVFIDFISMGNDQEIEFQEIKIGVFQEIRTLIRRSKVFYQGVEIIAK